MDESRLRGPGARPKGRGKGNITLYVADSDVEVWERARTYAYEHRVSLSSVVAEALARYLESGAEQG